MANQAGSIGKSVRSRRDALCLSQRDLARAAGTTAAAVSHIERSVRRPSASLLARIAGALQCSMDDLLAGGGLALEASPYLQQVIAAMKTFPPETQREVVAFCEYLKYRDRRRGK